MDFSAPEESDPEELQFLGLLQDNLNLLPDIEARLRAIAGVPGGILAREDAATSYDPLSHHLTRLCLSALEPLHVLGTVLAGSGLPAYSGYSLIRASLEAAALGHWLLGAGTMDKRVFRSLQLTLENRKDTDSFLSNIGREDLNTYDEVLTKLTELKDQRPRLRQKRLSRSFPNTTVILLEVSRAHTARTMRPVDVWRVCSGIAHSNHALAAAVLTTRQVGGSGGSSVNYEQTSSFRVVGTFFLIARELVDSLVTGYEAHASLK